MNEFHVTETEVIAPGFLEQLLDDPARLEHVRNCPECRDVIYTFALFREEASRGFPAVGAAAAERLRILLADVRERPGEMFFWRRLRILLTPGAHVLAAADGQSADQQFQESAAREGYLHFAAGCSKDDPGYWEAYFSIPVRPDAETVLRIRVCDGAGNRIESGVFHLCGLALPVSRGIALLPLRDFQRCLDVPMVSFEFSGGPCQTGAPTLFSTEEEL